MYLMTLYHMKVNALTSECSGFAGGSAVFHAVQINLLCCWVETTSCCRPANTLILALGV